MKDIRPEVEQLARELGGDVSVAVRNISNAFDFKFGSDERVWSASVIKVPVLVEAVKQLRDGACALDQEFELIGDDLTPGSGVLRFMHSGMKLTMKDLMVLMIITSDNHATNMLIDLLTPESITATMRGFGYTGTEVQRRIFDYAAMEKGLYNWIVASEIADLFVRIKNKEATGGEWDALALEILSYQLDKERLRVLLPEEAHVANKPGEQEYTMHDAGLIWTDKFCYSICVTTQGWESRSNAYMAIARISKLVYDAVNGSQLL